jgi:hypothetical protein
MSPWSVAALTVLRGAPIWLPGYLARQMSRPPRPAGTCHVLLCIADHFEPGWQGASTITQRQRLDRWIRGYPAIAARHRDADGHPPQHSFFYPIEEYTPHQMDLLASLCKEGFGDVEVHLHHEGDTAENLERTLVEYKTVLFERHRLLRRDAETRDIRFGFIHGNWALDNSHPQGRHCGVDSEIQVLRRAGCYADFTMPSAPDLTQTSTVNSLYHVTDDPGTPKSHDRGVEASIEGPGTGDLLCVQGPLALDWRHRKWGILPRLDNGELASDCLSSARRIDRWIRLGIGVRGLPEWIFVKLHTHGAQDANAGALLEGGLEALWGELERRYNDGHRFRLHYVTAFEMYYLITQAERGITGDPGDLLTALRERDRLFRPPGAVEPPGDGKAAPPASRALENRP